jgi:hypothetical protein
MVVGHFSREVVCKEGLPAVRQWMVMPLCSVLLYCRIWHHRSNGAITGFRTARHCFWPNH